jgi:hypothetical protein
MLGDGVAEHAADLRLAGGAAHGGHLLQQRGAGGAPRACLELEETPIPGQLDCQATEPRGDLEHFRLQVTGAVPGRFAAGGRVECEQQPAAGRRRGGRDPAEEGVDLATARLLRQAFVAAHEGGPGNMRVV